VIVLDANAAVEAAPVSLVELNVDGPFAGQVLDTLGDQFTLDELQMAIRRHLHHNRPHSTSSSRSSRPTSETVTAAPGACLTVPGWLSWARSPGPMTGFSGARTACPGPGRR